MYVLFCASKWIGGAIFMIEITCDSLEKEDTLSLKESKGVPVVTESGGELGRIKDITVNPVDLSVEGFVVESGPFSDEVYLSACFFSNIDSSHAVLKRDPLKTIRDKKVYSKQGRYLGVVKDVGFKGVGKPFRLKVSKGNGEILDIPDTKIDKVNSSVMLN
jgi:sporulation protein YlmC with PRC-barrel domain